MNHLTHIDEKGKASMVDVSAKEDSLRTAVAKGEIKLEEATITLIRDNQIKKGDVLTVAELAGIQAAKQTWSLIPLCHNITLSKVEVQCRLTRRGVQAESLVKCTGQTGVEMEALTAVSVALLTIYDMCKAVDKSMKIGKVKLVSKQKKTIKK
jgi:cyclic pyranopterin phosphate synthase